MRLLPVNLLYVVLLTLSSCVGFTFDNKEIRSKIASVQIEKMSDSIAEYEFEKELEKLLNNANSVEKKYKLTFSIKKSRSSLVIQRDTNTIREGVEFIVHYQLYDLKSTCDAESTQEAAPIHKGKFRQISTYNSVFSPYSTETIMSQTETDLYLASAEELRRRLIIFFTRRK